MKTEPLFDLINSLTMSEKRFFKIFSQRHVIGETNQYLLMFDFIDKNESTTNEILKKQSFVKNLSAEKNYLYRLILKSLNAYYADFSTKMKVQNLIISAEILAYKGLETQALKTLEKAEKTAAEAELFTHLLTIKQTEFEILSKLNNYDLALEKIKEFETIINKQLDFTIIQEQTTKLYQLRQTTGGIRSKKDIEQLDQIVTQQNKKGLPSKKSTLFLNSFNIAYLNATKDYKKELVYLEKVVDLYEANPFLIENSIKGYVSSLYNTANTYRNLKEYKKALLTLDKLDTLKTNKLISTSKSISAYIFYLSNNLRLLIHIINNEFGLAENTYERIKKDYLLHEDNINKSVVYEHLILVVRLKIEHKHFKEALQLSNIIINDTSFKKRTDILTYIRLLNLVIHFELKNDFTIEYLSSSAANYLKRKQRLYKTEKEIINFITKYTSGNKKALTKINNNLKLLKTDAYEKSMFTLFDFQKWVEEKLTKY
tara:strand:+ start:2320 stop:3774 length:1455 start_codon:yes stop_codon:yes gene_type:complete